MSLLLPIQKIFKSLDLRNNKIFNAKVETPSEDEHIANKIYVDNVLNVALPIINSYEDLVGFHLKIDNKKFIDNQVSTALVVTGNEPGLVSALGAGLAYIVRASRASVDSSNDMIYEVSIPNGIKLFATYKAQDETLSDFDVCPVITDDSGLDNFQITYGIARAKNVPSMSLAFGTFNETIVTVYLAVNAGTGGTYYQEGTNSSGVIYRRKFTVLDGWTTWEKFDLSDRLRNRGQYEDFTVGDVKINDVFTNDGIPYVAMIDFTASVQNPKPVVSDLNYLRPLADLKMQDYKPKNTTAHPHWCYTWDEPAFNLHFNTVRPNADSLNFNLCANGFVTGKTPWFEPPLGYGFYLWTAELRKAVGGFDNQDYTTTNNAPRNGQGTRGIRAATAEEMMLQDGTIFQKVWKDIDGNWYSGTKIGTQMWMRENLMTTRLEDGTDIPLIPYASWGTSAGTEYLFGRIVNPIDRALPQPSTITSEYMAVRMYGYHYTSWVASNANLINSGGWRVFTLADWSILNSYIATNYPTFDPKYWKRSRSVVNGIYNDPNLVEPRYNKMLDYLSLKNAPAVSFETLASKTITLASLTIATAGWTWNGSLWVYTISNVKIKSIHNADIIPMNQESVVLAADIQPYSIVSNGSIVLQANYKPSADFLVTILLRE